jgi:hypothetical protein
MVEVVSSECGASMCLMTVLVIEISARLGAE